MPKSDTLQFPFPLRLKSVLLCCLVALAGGCASGRSSSSDSYADMMKLPAPLQVEKKQEAGKSQVLLQGEEQSPWKKKDSTTVFSETPRLAGEGGIPATGDVAPKEVVRLQGKPVSINFKDMPLPAFINHVYGDILNLSFTLPPALKEKKDLVTLRSKADMTPTELYTLVTEIIGQYGVQASYQDELLTFSIADQRPGEIPLLVSGRTLPEVPVSHRPIFQLVELAVVRNTMVASWLRAAFKDQPLEILEDPARNAILLKGAFGLVQLAVDMIQVLDQPHMRSRHSLRVDPVYLDAKSLSTQLVNILAAEGINVGEKDTSVILLPVAEINALLVFAPDQAMLAHIRQWIQTIDQPGEMVQAGEGTSGIFSYQVKNTTAASIVEVLNKLVKNLPGDADGQAKPVLTDATQAKKPDSDKEKKDKAASVGEAIVDEVRNTIIFQGSGARWNQLLPVIHSMDQTDRMVLLEVIIAEITLDENEELGINWSHTKGDAAFGTAALAGGEDGLTVGGSGFSFILDTAGSVYARLNAFAGKNKLAILSTPRLMVKNGTEASIEVGKEVPFVSRSVTSTNVTTVDTAGIVSETQYRKTGILLQVKPTVFSGNRVELELSQEASETTPDDTNSTSSPSIFNRIIETSLTLNDGASVLLGGLITSNRSSGWQGVPWLSEIPYLGRLFKVDGSKATRTEMVMMIVPYIVDNNEEAKSLTRAFMDRLSYKVNQREDGVENPASSADQSIPAIIPSVKVRAVKTPGPSEEMKLEPDPLVIPPRETKNSIP